MFKPLRCFSPTSLQSRRGVTLIEMMVVLALLAILMGLAAPSMAQFIAKQRIEAAARALAEDLVAGRNEAIKRNAPVLVCPQSSTECQATPDGTTWAAGWRVCYDLDADDECDATNAADPNPVRIRSSVDPSLTLTGPNSRLTFNANGSLTSSDFTAFAVSSSAVTNWSYAIRISPAGTVTVRKV
jgi:type IV fimbrial biogenesis protein FimT